MKLSKPTINEQYAAEWNLRNANARKHGRSVKPMPVLVDATLLSDTISALGDLIREYNDIVVNVQTDEEADSYSRRVAEVSKIKSKLIAVRHPAPTR